MVNKFKSSPVSNRGMGCSSILVMVGWTIMIVLFSVGDLYSNWMTEQSMYESSSILNDMRWLNQLIFMGLVFIPLLIGFFTSKNPRIKNVLRIWTIGAGFSLATFASKKLWITYQQETAIMDIAILILFNSGLFFFQNRNPQPVPESKGKTVYFGLAVIIAVGLVLPFALWGALGSINDTLIYLIEGLLFAFFVIQVVFPYLYDKTLTPAEDVHPNDFLRDGFIVAMFFLLLVTGLGQNGSEPLLLIVLPMSGWTITFFAILSKNSQDRGKFAVGLIAAVALVTPLIWFDADELSLLVAGSSGEALDWAIRAAASAFSVSLLVFIFNLVSLKNIVNLKINRKFNWIISGIAVSALAVVYFLFGQPGFFGEKIFIVMKDQADLTNLAQIPNVADRRKVVYEELVNTATNSQSSIRAKLDSWHVSYTPYYLVNGLEADANPFLRMTIQKRDDVERVLESPQLRPLHESAKLVNSDPVDAPNGYTWNLILIGADKVQSELGITGEGIVIGQTDTGVDGRNQELADSYRGALGSDDYNWLDPWNGSAFPVDGQGHGTSGLSVITGKNVGIAPGTKWIGCVNLARNLGNPAVYLNCMQFMLAPYPQDGDAFTDGDTTKGAMIVNNSWGCPLVEGCDMATFEQAAKAMETAGIFMAVAAGNTGYYGCGSITDPLAIYSEVFTVGSINSAGELSDFSSLGPVTFDGSGRIKPDLLAPGEGIIMAFPNDQYTRGDGTSFAAPHVAGVVALMWSANPELIGNIELTRKILEETAAPFKGTMPTCIINSSIPNNAAGYGILDAFAAVQKAISLK
jgi:hypothetical protein